VIVREHRNLGGDATPEAHRVGPHHGRAVGVACPRHLDAHLDIVADGSEGVDGPVGEVAVPSNPSVGANRNAGRPDGPKVSVTSPSVASPTLGGGENPPSRRASRSGSTSLRRTSTITGTPGPVSA
jgi:hypothetical protein